MNWGGLGESASLRDTATGFRLRDAIVMTWQPRDAHLGNHLGRATVKRANT